MMTPRKKKKPLVFSNWIIGALMLLMLLVILALLTLNRSSQQDDIPPQHTSSTLPRAVANDTPILPTATATWIKPSASQTLKLNVTGTEDTSSATFLDQSFTNLNVDESLIVEFTFTPPLTIVDSPETVEITLEGWLTEQRWQSESLDVPSVYASGIGGLEIILASSRSRWSREQSRPDMVNMFFTFVPNVPTRDGQTIETLTIEFALRDISQDDRVEIAAIRWTGFGEH